MLAVYENLIPVKVFQNIACYDIFLDLAANACKDDTNVVAGFALFSLLEDCSHFGSLPVHVSKLFWKIMTKDNESYGASSFIILAGNISGPVALFGFSFCSNLRTPSAMTFIPGIARNGVPSGVVGVGEMLDELQWPNLEARSYQPSLLFFHKIHCGTVSIDKDKYLIPSQRTISTRSSHNSQYCRP